MAPNPRSVEKLDLIIHDKQAELRALEAELAEALTGIESPDYEWAARIHPLIYAVQFEIDRLEELRLVPDPQAGFAARLSRLLTDNALTALGQRIYSRAPSTLGLDHRSRRQAMLVQGAGEEPGPVRGFYPTDGRHNV